jgi:hypothetical protein
MTKVPGTWRKSSFSATETDCVEVSGALDAIRDSKNSDGGVLVVDVAAFVSLVKIEDH